MESIPVFWKKYQHTWGESIGHESLPIWCVFYRETNVSREHWSAYIAIEPTKRYLAALGVCDLEVWYGMRNAESSERKARYIGKVDTELYMPHEVMPSKYPKYLGKNGIRFRMPVIDWSVDDVKEFVGVENLNPLYAQEFERVGCFPCLAGGKKPNGYVDIRVDGKMMKAHRLIFMYHHGYYPEFVDHINGIKDDNRIENLRACTKIQNGQNQKCRKPTRNTFVKMVGMEWR